VGRRKGRKEEVVYLKQGYGASKIGEGFCSNPVINETVLRGGREERGKKKNKWVGVGNTKRRTN